MSTLLTTESRHLVIQSPLCTLWGGGNRIIKWSRNGHIDIQRITRYGDCADLETAYLMTDPFLLVPFSFAFLPLVALTLVAKPLTCWRAGLSTLLFPQCGLAPG